MSGLVCTRGLVCTDLSADWSWRLFCGEWVNANISRTDLLRVMSFILLN